MLEPSLVIALIAVAGMLCQWLSAWVRLPAILFLLLAGILLGPGLGWVNPDQLLGDLLFPLVSLSVAIILFEGSLTLKFEEIRGLARVVQRLVSIGMLTTWLITTAASHLFLGLNLPMSFLLGALVVVTGPTVIVPMLRTVRPNSRITNILRWEGIVIDPIGALLAVLVYETIVSLGAGGTLGHTLVVFLKTIGVGTALGAASGYALGLMLRHHLIPHYLHNLATVAMVLTAFSLSNHVEHESGLLAVTVMGMWLANMRDINVDDILSFKEHLSVLLISGLFVLLAARIDLQQLLALGWPALLLLAVIQFIARPAAVALSTLGSDLNWRERMLIAWIGPRGIVAAAVSALFALRLESSGYAEASVLVSCTFIVIIGTVVLQSGTARLLARLLMVAEPSPRGFLITGANPVSRAIASTLQEQGFQCLLADNNWDHIRQARMEGLQTFYGTAVSEYADRHLDLVGLGHLLAITPQREFNALACMRYRLEFGDERLFSIAVISDQSGADKHLVSSKHKGKTLFTRELTYAKLASLINRGARISATQLTQEYGWDDLYKETNEKLYLLFAINQQGRIQVNNEESALKAESGMTAITLNYADVAEKNNPSDTASKNTKS